MKLIKKNSETHDTCTLTFEGDRPDFRPGQFFMIEIMRKEKIPKRSYSVSSSPTRQGMLELTIKEMPNGFISKLLCDAKVGEEFMLDGPWGHFIFDEDKMHEVVMLSAGSGIAPFRAMCEYIIDKKLSTKVTLAYSNRTREDIICRKDLEAFAAKIPNMKLILALTREQCDGFYCGRIDAKMVKQVISENKNPFYFICGPPEMVSGTEQLLLSCGVSKEKIKTEKYG